jgi:hypothetical protein
VRLEGLSKILTASLNKRQINGNKLIRIVEPRVQKRLRSASNVSNLRPVKGLKVVEVITRPRGQLCPNVLLLSRVLSHCLKHFIQVRLCYSVCQRDLRDK